MELLDLIGPAAGGGIFGLLGSLGTGIFSWFKRKAEIKHELEVMDRQHTQELELRDSDLKYMKAEAEAANERFELELEGRQMEAATANLNASYDHDISSIDHQGHTLLLVAEFIRKIYRPALTTFLFFLVYSFYQEAPEASKAEIVQGVLSLAAAAGTWWFTDRTQLKSGTVR